MPLSGNCLLHKIWHWEQLSTGLFFWWPVFLLFPIIKHVYLTIANVLMLIDTSCIPTYSLGLWCTMYNTQLDINLSIYWIPHNVHHLPCGCVFILPFTRCLTGFLKYIFALSGSGDWWSGLIFVSATLGVAFKVSSCMSSKFLFNWVDLNSFSIVHLGGFAYMKTPKLVWISVVDFKLIIN